jgi:SAM-dependent methyltransferase
MDRTRFSYLAHRTHDFCNPISAAKIDRLIAEARLNPGDRVIDFGAGKAELLCRLVERYGVTGEAVDTAGVFLEEGRKRAAGRLPEGAIRFHESDAKAWLAANADARFQLACCVGSTHAFGDLCGTIEALKSCVAPGGRLLIGEGYWQRSPDAAYLEFFGATEDDYRSHEGNVRAGLEAGLIPMWACTASPDDWDEYEWRYSSAIERFAMDHPGDPDRPAMLERIRAWRAEYLRHGRGTLGFGLYLFTRA